MQQKQNKEYEAMPRYCKACHRGEWCLRVWRQGDLSTERLIPYNCRSWRHDGECRRWKGAQDYARILAAVQTRPDWSYMVLTMDQRDWDDTAEQYRFGVVAWARMRKRLTRQFGPLQYIQTWERFVKRGCHVNVLVGNQQLYEELGARPIRRDNYAHTWLSKMADECGFGWVCYGEQIKNDVAMSRYLTKKAQELTGSGVKDQTPWDAPPHFRRIRASQGLLPPPNKDPDLTGNIHFSPLKIMASILGHGPKDVDE